MEQSGTVILEYSKPQGPGVTGYWTGKVLGREMKFVRVNCGLAHPQLDRQAAALIILGELFRSFAHRTSPASARRWAHGRESGML